MSPMRIGFIIWTIAGAAGSGCLGTPPDFGVLTDPTSRNGRAARPGMRAPVIRFRTEQGSEYSSSYLYGDATVVLFTHTEGRSCLRPNPLLIREAKREAGPFVSFIEIITPSGGCPLHRVCSLVRHPDLKKVATICDPEGRARERFGVVGQDAVLVLDPRGRIQAVGRLEDMAELSREARRLARQAVRIGQPFR